ncbi:DUF3332 domain-containing protein [Vibrio sp. WXL210]|uniref:DUF3332 domain-containing protein n=1 Tax=Vibrio sp. WXL210 TaxID=3450709 RepID=UPI003EC80963
MNTKLTKLAVLASCGLALSGCVGSNAITGMVMELNVKAVDNRYARGGLNMLLAPVYGVALAADYIVVNSLEFWTGKNPINGSPHIFDTKTDTYIEVNDQIDPSLHSAPLPPVTNTRTIEQGEMIKVDENTVQMDISYSDGGSATLTGIKDGERVSYYLDGELISQTTLSELETFAASRS